MYPVSPTPKKTIAGLPIRNIDYGSLHKSLRVSERDDVKSKLEPHFLNTLGNMCLNASAQSEKSVGKTGGYHGNAISYQDDERTKRNAKEAAYTCTLNNDRSNIPQSKLKLCLCCLRMHVTYCYLWLCLCYSFCIFLIQSLIRIDSGSAAVRGYRVNAPFCNRIMF